MPFGAAGLGCGARLSPCSAEVMLFEHPNCGGLCEVFVHSENDLQDHLIGGNRASSIKIGSGVQARLFSAPNYRGISSGVYARSDENFGDDPIGHDHADSLLIANRCDVKDKPAPNQVMLYWAASYRDFCEPFTASDAALGNNVIGLGTSSLRVGSGVIVRLCPGASFHGTCETFADEDVANLVGTTIGNDRAGSIRIERR